LAKAVAWAEPVDVDAAISFASWALLPVATIVTGVVDWRRRENPKLAAYVDWTDRPHNVASELATEGTRP